MIDNLLFSPDTLHAFGHWKKKRGCFCVGGKECWRTKFAVLCHGCQFGFVFFFSPFPKCQLSCIPACVSMQTRNLNNLFGLGSAAVQNDLHGTGTGIMF